MKFYDLLVKKLNIDGLINSVFKLNNNSDKAGIEFNTNQKSNPFIGFDKTIDKLVGSNDGSTFFTFYDGQGLPYVIEKEAVNNTLTISIKNGFPIGIITPNNVVIPIQKETIILSNSDYIINLPAYIIYAGLDNSDGIWKIYVASGVKGEKGDNAISVTTPVVETLQPNENATANADIDENGLVTFSFGIPKGKEGEKGEKGDPINLEVGSVVSGKYPSVELVGEAPNQTINFVIPSLLDSSINVSSANNNKISVPTNSIPVMLKTNTDQYYNIKGSEITLNENKTNFVIDISNALAIYNISSFEGDWTVYYAGGAKQFYNIPFHPNVNGVGDLSNSNSEIYLDTYLIDSNGIDVCIKSEKSGNVALKILVDDVELQTVVLDSSTSIKKKKINFNISVTGSVKIVRDYNNTKDTLNGSDVKIYKIEG